MPSKQTYETADFYLAAFLKAKGLKIDRIERDGRKTIFIFENTATREGLIKDFYNEGLVGVNDYKNAIQDMRAIVYNW